MMKAKEIKNLSVEELTKKLTCKQRSLTSDADYHYIHCFHNLTSYLSIASNAQS